MYTIFSIKIHSVVILSPDKYMVLTKEYMVLTKETQLKLCQKPVRSYIWYDELGSLLSFLVSV